MKASELINVLKIGIKLHGDKKVILPGINIKKNFGEDRKIELEDVKLVELHSNDGYFICSLHNDKLKQSPRHSITKKYDKKEGKLVDYLIK